MNLATYAFYVDWNNDEDFGDANENISAYVLRASWEFGNSSLLPGQTGAGNCRLILDNSTSIFSPGNPTLTALPGMRVKITMTIGGGVPVTMWAGYLETLDPVTGPTVGTSTAELIAYGTLAQSTGARPEIAMQTDITTVAAAIQVLAAAGVPAGDYLMSDTGQSTLSRFWTRDKDLLGVLRELEAAECGLLRETKDGKIDLEDRAHRLSAPHTVVQSTYGTGTLNIWNLRQMNSLPGIFNLVETRVRTFNESEDTVLAIIADVAQDLGGAPPMISGAGGSPLADGMLTIWIEIPTPSSPSEFLAVSDWGIVDYEVNTAADGTGTDITTDVTPVRTEYGNRIKLEFSNANASDGYFVLLRAHGQAVVEGDPLPVSAEDGPVNDPDTSQGKYRIRNFPNPNQWITDQTEGQDYCDHIIALHKDPRARIAFDLRANYDAVHLAEAQRLDVSDRIHVEALSDFGLYVDGDFFVEWMRHSVDAARVHTVALICSAADPEHVWPASGTPYAAKEVPTGVPDDLYVTAIDPGMHCTFGCEAWKDKQNITGARFRARYFPGPLGGPADLRLISEGGTMEHDPENGMYVVDDLYASIFGAQYEFDSVDDASPPASLHGCWYYAFQFKSRPGDSRWSDGTKDARHVTDYLATDALFSDGPPSDWWVEVEPDIVAHKVRVRASRPKVNGGKIWRWIAQIKDNRTGLWRPLCFDAWGGTGADLNYGYWLGGDMVSNYPPPADSHASWRTHAISLDNRRFTRTGGQEYPGACEGLQGPHGDDYVKPGKLVMLDIRGAVWDIRYCQWATVYSVEGVRADPGRTAAADYSYFDIEGRFRNLAAATDLRVVVQTPFWEWTDEGYFGAQPNRGVWDREFWSAGQHGDATTEVFVSDWIDVPSSVPLSAIEARAFFDNGYSVSDGGDNEGVGMITGGVVGDTGNPSGASNLQIITHADDPNIPPGQIAFQFNRDTENYRGIYRIAVVLSEALPAEGPFDAERTGHPDCVIEEGTCSVVRGDRAVTVTRTPASPPAADGRAFLIFTDDASPDSDLDGNVIASEGEDSIVLTSPFNKTGDYDYAVVKRWWDLAAPDTGNLAYYEFVPQQCAWSMEQSIWRTPSVAAPVGPFYATAYSRNLFGVGTRITSASAETPTVVTEDECIALSIIAGHVATDASLGRIFSIAATASFTLDNPTGLARCGQVVVWMIKQSGGGSRLITLDSKFRLGTIVSSVTLSTAQDKWDYLGCIYNSADDKLDVVAFVKGYG